jgi:hypothetical protein
MAHRDRWFTVLKNVSHNQMVAEVILAKAQGI